MVQPGRSAIEIGRADGAGAITALALPLSDPTILLSGEGAVALTGLTLTGSLTIDTGGGALAGALNLAGNDLTVRGVGQATFAAIAGDGALSIEKSGGAATFAGSVQVGDLASSDGDYELAFLQGFSAGTAALAHDGLLRLGDAASDASIVAPGGFLRAGPTRLAGRLEVHGGGVQLGPLELAAASTIDASASGGDVSLGVVDSLGAPSNLSIRAGSGSVQTGPIGASGSLGALTIEAGSAALAAIGNARGAGAASTNVEAAGALMLGLAHTTGAQPYQAGAILLSGDIRAGGAGVVFGGPAASLASLEIAAESGVVAFAGALDTGAEMLTLTAGEIDFFGPVSGSGRLTLRQGAPGQAVIVGGVGTTPALDLTAAELTLVQPGRSAVEIGRSDGAASLDVLSLGLAAPVTLLSGDGAITLAGSRPRSTSRSTAAATSASAP